ncbi:MAG: DUF4316 domain-containing protein [Acidaminococcaceae bacterium]
MNDKNNPLQTVELSTEQNTNMIDGILNNAPPQLSPPEEKPPDKVRERPDPRRSREREER